jgi:hypothetical protein
MYFIKFTFANGDVRNLFNTDSYDEVCRWWKVFSRSAVMADVGITDATLYGNGSVIAHKIGWFKVAA